MRGFRISSAACDSAVYPFLPPIPLQVVSLIKRATSCISGAITGPLLAAGVPAALLGPGLWLKDELDRRPLIITLQLLFLRRSTRLTRDSSSWIHKLSRLSLLRFSLADCVLKCDPSGGVARDCRIALGSTRRSDTRTFALYICLMVYCAAS